MLAPQEIESVFLRPSMVASRRFTRTTGGYDTEEVHQFLEDVADYLSRLEAELEWRRARRTTRPTGTLGEQREAISVVAEARGQAERILAEARKDAEGYVRLARAIAHQLALEAQTRRPQVALAVTRASGSSTTVEGHEDLEVWIDPSILDLTKLEEPTSENEVEVSEGTGAAPAAQASVEAPAAEVPAEAPAAEATVEAPAAETTSDVGTAEPTADASTSTDTVGAEDATKVQDEVTTTSDEPSAEEMSPTVGLAPSETPEASDRKPGKKKKKSKKKF
ncbi:MAG TPA: DivIVA domain-containing protein [Actinomycetota bacterium]|nr:DivIVA domain-containing protein [Actinomycetota bacterium]